MFGNKNRVGRHNSQRMLRLRHPTLTRNTGAGKLTEDDLRDRAVRGLRWQAMNLSDADRRSDLMHFTCPKQVRENYYG